MSKQFSVYEVVPHGISEFPISFYSETVYNVNPHYHKEYELFWISEGEMRFGIENEEYIISSGTVIFIEPNIVHYAYDTPENGYHHFYSLIFDVSALGNADDPCRKALESVKINRFLVIPKHIFSESDKLFEMMKNYVFGEEIKMKTFLFELISYIIMSNQFTKHSDPKINKLCSAAAINTAIKYIEEHYKEKLSISDVLAKVSYSKSHLMRLFKNKTGLSFIDYLNKYRIEKSCLELLYSNKSISNIAVDNGFNNVQYYSKIFKMFMDTTPKRYRELAYRFQKPTV